MKSHHLFLVLLALAVLVLMRKRTAPPDQPTVEVYDDRIRPERSGRPIPSAGTLIGRDGPAPWSNDSRGSHYVGQFDRIRRN